jgi:hypothetical protein
MHSLFLHESLAFGDEMPLGWADIERLARHVFSLVNEQRLVSRAEARVSAVIIVRLIIDMVK